MAKIYTAIDTLSERFGKHTIHHGASLPVKLHTQHKGERGDIVQRKVELFRGESKRQRIGLPVMNVKV